MKPTSLAALLTIALLTSPQFARAADPPRPSVTTFAMAIQAAEAIPESEPRAENLARIAQVQAQAGYRKEARTTLSRAWMILKAIPRHDIGSSARTIAEAQEELGDVQAALDTLQTFYGPEKQFGGIYYLSEIATRQAKAGRKKEAAATFTLGLRCIRTKTDANAVMELNNLAEAQAKAGFREASAATFAEAIDSARQDWKEPEALANGLSYNIGRQQIAAGLRTEGLATLVTARLLTSEQTEKVHAAISRLSYILDQQWKAGDRRAALDTFALAQRIMQNERHVRDTDRDSELEEFAAMQAYVGRVAEALKTAEAIGYLRFRAMTLQGIAALQARAGEKRSAAETLTRAAEAAQGC